MSKMMVVCNHPDPGSIMSTMIMGSSGLAVDNEVIMFFGPGGSSALLKGELEKIRDMKLKGLPDPVELYNNIVELGGKVYLCILALENKGINPDEDLREGVEVVDAPTFLMEAEGAGITLTF